HRAARAPDPEIERVAEREVVRVQADDPCPVLRRDVAGAVDRAGIHQQDFEVAIGLALDRAQELGEPALLVERADDDAGLRGRVVHGMAVGSRLTATEVANTSSGSSRWLVPARTACARSFGRLVQGSSTAV